MSALPSAVTLASPVATTIAPSVVLAPLALVRPRLPIRAGFKYRRPGAAKSYDVTVLRAFVQSGPLSSYTNGVWVVHCFCGKKFHTTTALIRRLSPHALSCGCVSMRKPRVSGKRVFRPNQRHVGMTYGRLKVKRWRVDEQDWECVCSCGEIEYVKPTWRLGIAGGRKCHAYAVS